MEQEELCKLYDRYGGFLLQRGDSTLLAFLQKEERIHFAVWGSYKKMTGFLNMNEMESRRRRNKILAFKKKLFRFFDGYLTHLTTCSFTVLSLLTSRVKVLSLERKG